jgi:hypothetical protein
MDLKSYLNKVYGKSKPEEVKINNPGYRCCFRSEENV